MTLDKWIVLGLGILAIVGVLWYFLLAPRRREAATVASSGVQEVKILVRGGYDPGHVVVQAGRPVRLVFDRRETAGCSEEVVLPDFRIRRFLPPNEPTAVEFTPERPGEYEFTCGMGMLRGTLSVQ